MSALLKIATFVSKHRQDATFQSPLLDVNEYVEYYE